MIVALSRVDVLVDPVPYRPRKAVQRAGRVLGEHARRIGDPNRGGSTRQPIVTAYQQEALRCAAMLASNRPMTPRRAARHSGLGAMPAPDMMGCGSPRAGPCVEAASALAIRSLKSGGEAVPRGSSFLR
jgi:hypothetical protein